MTPQTLLLRVRTLTLAGEATCLTSLMAPPIPSFTTAQYLFTPLPPCSTETGSPRPGPEPLLCLLHPQWSILFAAIHGFADQAEVYISFVFSACQAPLGLKSRLSFCTAGLPVIHYSPRAWWFSKPFVTDMLLCLEKVMESLMFSPSH